MIQEHYYYFGDELQQKLYGQELNEKNWNLLRIDEVEGPFSIENSVESYENNCMSMSSYRDIAQIIITELERNQLKGKIVSLGCGKGILEWHIKKMCPSKRIECTDYAADAIGKLKKVFIDMDDGYPFDMLEGDYCSIGNDSIVIMYRVSTEFNRDQWLSIFEKMYKAGIKNVVYVPAGLDTKEDMENERIRHMRNIDKGKKDFFCGWLYSEDEFLKIFRGERTNPLYVVDKRIPYDKTAIYFLSINE